MYQCSIVRAARECQCYGGAGDSDVHTKLCC